MDKSLFDLLYIITDVADVTFKVGILILGYKYISTRKRGV